MKHYCSNLRNRELTRATLLFNSFCSNVAKHVARFCSLRYRNFRFPRMKIFENIVLPFSSARTKTEVSDYDHDDVIHHT